MPPARTVWPAGRIVTRVRGVGIGLVSCHRRLQLVAVDGDPACRQPGTNFDHGRGALVSEPGNPGDLLLVVLHLIVAGRLEPFQAEQGEGTIEMDNACLGPNEHVLSFL